MPHARCVVCQCVPDLIPHGAGHPMVAERTVEVHVSSTHTSQSFVQLREVC